MFDVIIVGAGAAGCVLANRLTEDSSRSVLLIEAGPDFPTVDSLPDEIRLAYSSPSGQIARSYDWAYPARVGSRTDRILRGKITGGSSAVNAQFYLRGLPYDFDRWAAMGNSTWNWAHVEPFFQKVETDLDFSQGHGQDGPIHVRRYDPKEWTDIHTSFYQACRDNGFPDCPDLNKPYATGVGPIPMNNPGGIRISAALGYLYPIRSRANLTIHSETLTHRICFEGLSVCGVETERSDGRYEIVRAKEIIIAAGAIGSPLLLLRSGIGPAIELEAIGLKAVVDLAGVGKNLHDHPAIASTWRVNTSGPSDTHLHMVGMRYTAAGSEELDDMMILAARGNRPQFVLTTAVNLAHSVGSVAIRSADPHAEPTIDYGLLTDAFDCDRMREAIYLCRRLVNHAAFTSFMASPLQPTNSDLMSDTTLDAWMMENVATAHHVSCTCKMGPSTDPFSVVDQFGYVHGLNGLRIVDASIMPDCVRANTHATVMMMAEKLAKV